MQTQRREYREPDYKRYADNEPYWHSVKTYFDPAIIEAEVAARGLRAEKWEFPKAAFVVVRIKCTLAEFKAAQYSWIVDLIANPPEPIRPKVTTEIDLFV